MAHRGGPGEPAGDRGGPHRSWRPPVKCHALAIGPGLGRDAATQEEIRAVIARARSPSWSTPTPSPPWATSRAARQLLAGRAHPTVLTPHDGEYARLAGAPPGDDRLAAARDLAAQLGAVVLLKGPLTAVAAPGYGPPDVLLAGAGVPALATAGTGDVLSGVIGAFLARGVPAHLAAALAAHVHGRAACPRQERGPGGGRPARPRRRLSQRGCAAMAEGTLKRLRAGVHGARGARRPAGDRREPGPMAQGRSRPAWAEIDLAAITHNAGVLSRLVQPGPALRRRQGARLRARRPVGRPGPRWPEGRSDWPWPWSTRGSSCASTTCTAPSSC